VRSSILVLTAIWLSSPALADLDAATLERVQQSIVKVRAVKQNGALAHGSAVAIGAGRFITNCHGTRKTRRLFILSRGEYWLVRRVVKDTEHDLCLLETDAGEFAPLQFADKGDALRLGEHVAAIGFAQGEARISEGTIKALHAHDDAKVVQTDAAFKSGESGGALVDREGKLIGVLTFYADASGDYFAMPVAWVRALAARTQSEHAAESDDDAVAFWERPDQERPPFLRAAAREYVQDWEALKEIAEQWVRQDARDPQAWIALGKAYQRGRQYSQAVAALKEALQLEPRHAEGWYCLGVAYLGLNENELVRDTLDHLEKLSPESAKSLRDLAPKNP
jgi:serine protease Do